IPRRGGRGQRGVEAGEVRPRDAPLLARAAVVAGEAAVVTLREDGAAPDGHDALPPERLENLRANVGFRGGHLHRLEEDAVGELWQPLRLTAHADESLDVLVPGGDILVADRPVGAVAVPGVRLEIQIAPAIDLSSPHD